MIQRRHETGLAIPSQGAVGGVVAGMVAVCCNRAVTLSAMVFDQVGG